MKSLTQAMKIVLKILNKVQHTPSNPNLQINALDGLRGIAILLVLFSHLSNCNMHAFYRLSFSGVGKVGVWLFFVLSAFLLTRPLLMRSFADIIDKRFLFNYILRRFFRIYPLYLFVLFLSYLCRVFLGTPFPFSITGHELLEHMGLQAGKSVLWSIPVEFKYYFVLPFVAAFLVLIKRNLIYSVLAIVLASFLTSMVWPSSLVVGRHPYILGPYLPIFLVGSLLALIYSSESLYRHSRDKTVRILLDAVAIGCVLVVFLTIPSVYSAVTGQDVPRSYFEPIPNVKTEKMVVFGVREPASV